MTDSGIENIVHIVTEDGSLKDNKLFHNFYIVILELQKDAADIKLKKKLFYETTEVRKH